MQWEFGLAGLPSCGLSFDFSAPHLSSTVKVTGLRQGELTVFCSARGICAILGITRPPPTHPRRLLPTGRGSVHLLSHTEGSLDSPPVPSNLDSVHIEVTFDKAPQVIPLVLLIGQELPEKVPRGLPMESYPQVTGARPCTKASDVEPRAKVTPGTDRAPLELLPSPLILTSQLPDLKLGKNTHHGPLTSHLTPPFQQEFSLS